MTQANINSLYKRITIIIAIAAVCMIGVSAAYFYLATPQIKSFGVAEREIVSNTDAINSSETVEAVVTEVEQVETDNLLFNNSDSSSNYIWVPMPEGTSAADVAIENHYMEGELWIDISKADTEFYRNNYISGNLDSILGGHVSLTDEGMVIKFNMEYVYEYNTIFENGVLYIEKVQPSMLYDRIVVVDAAGFVPQELLSEESLSPTLMCLDIAAKLKTLLEAEKIKVYTTCIDEREVSEDDRLKLMKEIRPDMYVRIETSYDEDSKVYGTETVYNGTYFIPGFGSVEFADLLESAVTTSIGGRVEGMVEAGENDFVIKNAMVPASTIKVGYYTNMQENILLNRDDYRSKIAQGIYNAIMAGFDGEE